MTVLDTLPLRVDTLGYGHITSHQAALSLGGRCRTAYYRRDVGAAYYRTDVWAAYYRTDVWAAYYRTDVGAA